MNHIFNALLKVHFIKSRMFSLISFCGNVVDIVEKSYVDNLVAGNPLHFNLPRKFSSSARTIKDYVAMRYTK